MSRAGSGICHRGLRRDSGERASGRRHLLYGGTTSKYWFRARPSGELAMGAGRDGINRLREGRGVGLDHR